MNNCNRLAGENGATVYGEDGVETRSVTGSISDGLGTPVADVVEYVGPEVGTDVDGASV